MNDQHLPTHPTLTHPHTRLPISAVGIVRGRPVWPVMGASPDDDGGGGNDGGGSGGSGDGGNGGGQSGGQGGGEKYTPPATQADFDRAVDQRLSRLRASYGMSPDEAKAFKKRADDLEHDLSSETEKQVRKAAKDATETERAKGTTRAVRAEFRAAAKGVLDKEALDDLFEDIDLAKYADDDGEPDVDKIEAKVKRRAPKNAGNNVGGGGQGHPPPPRSLGQGDRHNVPDTPGSRGLAMAEKRFGKKQQ